MLILRMLRSNRNTVECYSLHLWLEFDCLFDGIWNEASVQEMEEMSTVGMYYILWECFTF